MSMTIVQSGDPRVKRTRDLLRGAFLELLAEKGFREMTVQDIADRATVNRATFYAHYTDKFALMDDCIRSQFRRMLAAKLSAAAPASLDALHDLILTVFDFMALTQHDCSVNKQFDPLLETAVQEEIYTVLLAWLQRPSAATTALAVSPEVAASLASWAIFGLATQWSRGERKPPAAEMAAQIVTVLANGLPFAQGRTTGAGE